jgi:hypothetical protein
MGKEIINHILQSPDLVPCNQSMNMHLGGQQFKTFNELKCCVLN